METQQCRACGAGRKKTLFEKTEIPYFQCLDCNFIFSYPQVNANFANAIDDYEAAYLNYLGDSDCDQKNLASVSKWMNQYCSFEGKRILDIGAGSGKFVRYFRDKGFNCFGLEPAKVLFEKYLSKDPYFFCGRMEDFSEDSIGGKVDILTSWDVLEHIEQPDQFFKDTSRMLNSGGFLFLNTPDVGSLLPRIIGRRWHHFNKYHYSFFSRKTITALAQQNGLEEIDFTRISYFKSIRYVLQYLNDFGFGAKRSAFLEKVTEWAVPVNVHDMMFVAFQKN